MFSRFFIYRPIFASVLSIVVTLAGGIAVWVLPVAQYPEITPPTVEVSASYPGADSQTLADTVAAPIEQQVNGVEGMMYMSSQCANDGSYTLTVTFKLGVDLDMAQVLVQNRVAMAQPVLPDLVNRNGVKVKKKSPNVLMIVNLFSPDGSRNNLDLSNYATIQLRDELARLAGVADITYLGQRDYSMRLWLDPEKMASRNLSASDVVLAVQQQNIQVAAGQIGQPPVPPGQVFQYTMTTLGRLIDADQFADMILKTDQTGRIVRMRDVARVDLGAQSYDQACTLDGKPSVALSIYQLPGSNALKTAQLVRAKMEELRKRFPAGIDYAIVYDTTPFITESIGEVFKTLRDAVILVALVVLLFLQNWRSAVIPLIAVPVAIVGTFAVMAAMNFSLNNLTLFGLVLAIGIVVDDAIVVVEAVEYHIEHGLGAARGQHQGDVAGLRPGDRRRPGPQRGVRAVRVHQRDHGAVLPAVRLDDRRLHAALGVQLADAQPGAGGGALASARGKGGRSAAAAGVFPRRRMARLRVAHALAGAVARAAAGRRAGGRSRFHCPRRVRVGRGRGLVDRPRPRRLFPRRRSAGSSPDVLNRILGGAFRGFNRGFNRCANAYTSAVGATLPRQRDGPVDLRRAADADLLRLHPRSLGLHSHAGQGLPVGQRAIARRRLGRADRARHAPHRKDRPRGAGRGAHGGRRRAIDPPGRQRAELRRDVRDAQRLPRARRGRPLQRRDRRQAGKRLPHGNRRRAGQRLRRPAGRRTGHRRRIQADRRGPRRQRPRAPSSRPARPSSTREDRTRRLQGLFSSFRADTPWLFLDIDRTQAKMMGVPFSEINSTLQVYLGSYYVNDFNRFGRTWQVNVQADARFPPAGRAT